MTPLQQAAYNIGAKGSEPTETERIAFEAWMRGHCWQVEGEWDGEQYKYSHEVNGFVDGGAANTRRLWAAWRDRAALAAQQTPSAATDELALAASGEIMTVMYGAMPPGGSVQLRAMVQCIVQRAIDAQQVAVPARERAKVGDSQFESWYGETKIQQMGTKQRYREAYEAGLNEKAQQAAGPVNKREPLTVDEITDWFASENGLEDCSMCAYLDFQAVIRAVEARHGIKAAPQPPKGDKT